MQVTSGSRPKGGGGWELPGAEHSRKRGVRTQKWRRWTSKEVAGDLACLRHG